MKAVACLLIGSDVGLRDAGEFRELLLGQTRPTAHLNDAVGHLDSHLPHINDLSMFKCAETDAMLATTSELQPRLDVPTAVGP